MQYRNPVTPNVAPAVLERGDLVESAVAAAGKVAAAAGGRMDEGVASVNTPSADAEYQAFLSFQDVGAQNSERALGGRRATRKR